MKKTFVLVSVFMLPFLACTKTGSGNGNEDSKGIVRGKVTDTDGNPIAGATIVINNTVFFNKNIVLTSNAKGEYSYKMPAEDSWYVRGSVKVNYSGRQYELPLHPDFAGSFTGTEGKEVNLTWKMTGAVPTDFGHSGYYGGRVTAQSVVTNLSDLYGLVLTLTPQGNLINGKPGNTITLTAQSHSNEFVTEDIPIGRYAITAKLNGQTIYMNPTSANPYNTYVSQLIMDFEPAYNGATTYKLAMNVSLTP